MEQDDVFVKQSYSEERNATWRTPIPNLRISHRCVTPQILRGSATVSLSNTLSAEDRAFNEVP